MRFKPLIAQIKILQFSKINLHGTHLFVLFSNLVHRWKHSANRNTGHFTQTGLFISISID
jgi:uncharacterized membrane protein YcfT